MSTLSEPRRPRLLPQNRKLRHLKGLSLRNLSFAPTTLRTTDDALVGGRSPQTQRNKLETLNEAAPLQHSRSSESLRKDSLRAAAASPSSESLRKGRPRRTSLNLGSTHVTPSSRQKTLEELVDGVVGDVFFTLHVKGDDEPVYISEVRHRSANFNFSFFELDDKTPWISRACRLTIRVWARRPKSLTWIFLLEEMIDLRQLNFVGTLMDRRFPPNALVFHLEDGLYSLDFPNRIAEPKQAPPVPTASHSTLMKLANLESSIDDAIQTQTRIMHQINEILNDTPVDASDTAEEDVQLADKYVAIQQRTNRTAERRRDQLRESIRSRKAAIAEGRELHNQAAADMASSREKLENDRELVEKTEQQIHGQRRRICSELSDVFPITPIPNAPPLSFQICNIPLPNSAYNASIARTLSEDVLSAGLGLVAMLTRHLQFYLSHSLPYPLYPYGSRSYTRDDISQLTDRGNPRREFPLYLPRGGSTTGQWRFEYAWFLLNKDIESLCASQGLRVVDIRHSLPNLKYLLYVGSAGSNEVPERKKGGVRGLWLGRLKGRVSIDVPDSDDGSVTGSRAGSRRGSVDSEVMDQHGEALRNAIIKGSGNENGHGHGHSSLRAPSGLHEFALPFADETKFTFRTKGLRENVG